MRASLILCFMMTGKDRMRMKRHSHTRMNCKKWGIALFRYVLLTGLAFVILYPFLIKLSIAFMPLDNLYDATVRFLPKSLTLDNFRTALAGMEYWKSLLKTIGFTGSISLVQVFFAMAAAYGLACFRFPGRRILYVFVFLTLIVPPQTIILPLYLYFQSFDIGGVFQAITGAPLSLMGSPITLFLMAATGLGLKNGLLIFIFRQFFKGIPRELEESACIDGAGVIKTFGMIVLPSAMPMILTGFLFTFVWQWTDGFYTSIFLPGNTLLARQLQMLVSQASSSGEMVNSYAVSLMNNAGILLFVTPILLLYLVCQRHFIESIERTGLVG